MYVFASRFASAVNSAPALVAGYLGVANVAVGTTLMVSAQNLLPTLVTPAFTVLYTALLTAPQWFNVLTLLTPRTRVTTTLAILGVPTVVAAVLLTHPAPAPVTLARLVMHCATILASTIVASRRAYQEFDVAHAVWCACLIVSLVGPAI